MRRVRSDADPRCLKGANDDDVLLCRQVAGNSTAHQDGRDAATAPGDVFLLDPRRPFALGVGANTRSIVFKVPRWELQARLGEIASYTATLIPRAEPVTALASEFLAMLALRADAIDPSMGAKVAQQALDLVALAFEARTGSAAQLSSTRTTTLMRLKSIIEARLNDPELKPLRVAAVAGISVRYANALPRSSASSCFAGCSTAAKRWRIPRSSAAPSATSPIRVGSPISPTSRGATRRSSGVRPASRAPDCADGARATRSLLARPSPDQPHESFDLRAIMVLVGAHEKAVRHLHHHAEATVEHLAALAVPVHELDLETDGVAVGGQLEWAVEDVVEILTHPAQCCGDLLPS